MKRILQGIFALGMLAALCGHTAQAQNGTPPSDTHMADIKWGRTDGVSNNGGTTGIGTAAWFGNNANVNAVPDWLATPRAMAPNVNGPNSEGLGTQGNFFFNIGFDVITTVIDGRNRNILQRGKIVRIGISDGLEIWQGAARIFAPNTVPNAPNQWLFGIQGAQDFGWHKHFIARAFRPGVYSFSFQLQDAADRDGNQLANSQVYTLTLQNRAVLTGKAILDGWIKPDNTRNKVGNVARIFIFPNNGTAITRESQALKYTDVYLDLQGNYALPEGLVPLGNYRIGIKPLTAKGLAKLLPMPYALNADTPEIAPDITIPLGDINSDSAIDIGDLLLLIAKYNVTSSSLNYSATVDINGDGAIDIGDLLIMIRSYNTRADFTP